MTDSAIRLEDVCASRGGVEVLRGVSLSLDSGEVVVLVGPSASGKSTILRVILGLSAPTRGRVVLRGEPASVGRRILVPPEERNLGMVFQDLALWPHLSVRGNLAFGLAAHGIERDEQESRIETTLRRVSLLEKRDRRPGELSGGERQRVAIARALVLEPTAVLLDEPLANLDVLLKRQLLTLFRDLFHERRTAVLYVTHDPREAAALADRLVIIDAGTIVDEGSLAELRARPRGTFSRSLLDDGE